MSGVKDSTGVRIEKEASDADPGAPSTTSSSRKTSSSTKSRPKHIFLCPHCGRKYTHPSSLNKHINGIHKLCYRCNICNKSCPDKRLLDSHINKHNGMKPYMCEVCKKTFRNKNQLSSHHCKANPVEFSCRDCKQIFSKKCLLTQHLKTHRSEAILCKYCGMQFKFASGRYRHEKKRCPALKRKMLSI